jgi:carboxyl-terminal processing protease
VPLPPSPVSAADTAFQRALGTKVPQFRDALTDYALSLKATRAVASPDFVVTPEMRAELLRRMQSRGVTIDAATYAAASPLVDRLLGNEIARYVFGEAAEYSRRLRDDAAVTRASELIGGATTQQELLRRAASTKP